jgi:hypothetical protein
MNHISLYFVGRDPKFPNAVEMVYTLKERKYYEQIEKAYSYASKLLLDLLMSMDVNEHERLSNITLRHQLK